MDVQKLLDSMLIANHYRSVMDLQYIPDEKVVFVKRKMGFKDTVINVGNDRTEMDVKTHIESVPAIY